MIAMQRRLEEEARKSSESRARVHQKLEDIQSEAQESSQRISAVERVVEEEVRPVVRSVLDWRARTLGSVFVLGLIGSVVLFVFTAAKDLIIDLWRTLNR